MGGNAQSTLSEDTVTFTYVKSIHHMQHPDSGREVSGRNNDGEENMVASPKTFRFPFRRNTRRITTNDNDSQSIGASCSPNDKTTTELFQVENADSIKQEKPNQKPIRPPVCRRNNFTLENPCGGNNSAFYHKMFKAQDSKSKYELDGEEDEEKDHGTDDEFEDEGKTLYTAQWSNALLTKEAIFECNDDIETRFMRSSKVHCESQVTEVETFSRFGNMRPSRNTPDNLSLHSVLSEELQFDSSDGISLSFQANNSLPEVQRMSASDMLPGETDTEGKGERTPSKDGTDKLGSAKSEKRFTEEKEH